MEVKREWLDRYTETINARSLDAKEKARRRIPALMELGLSKGQTRELLISVVRAIVDPEVTVIEAVAGWFYNGLRERELGNLLNVKPDSGYVPESTERATRYFYEIYQDTGDLERLMLDLEGRIDYEVQRAAGQTTLNMGAADPAHPKFARVPTGAETCLFCIMLAGLGFHYSTYQKAGGGAKHGTELDHYHANCDCRIVPSFGGASVEGYDPKTYSDMFYQMVEDKARARAVREYGEDYTQEEFIEVSNAITNEYREAAAKAHKRHGNQSVSRYRASNAELSFNDFDDLKEYIYNATDLDDLERRLEAVRRLYNYDESIIGGTALERIVRTMEKVLGD